jgi:hypothetical protein
MQEVGWLDEEPASQTGGLQQQFLIRRRLPAATQAVGG